MDASQELRLQNEAAFGEEAEVAIHVCGLLFPKLREDIYQKLEGEAPDMVQLRANLLALRNVEESLGAYIRSGKMALNELKKAR